MKNRIIRSNKIAQISFIAIGVALTAMYLLSNESNLAVFVQYLAVAFVAGYLIYLGIMGLLSGNFPHDEAKLIFDSPQVSGVKAKVFSIILVMSSFCVVAPVVESYFADGRINKLDEELLREINRIPKPKQDLVD